MAYTQNDVRVSVVEGSITLLWPRDNMKVFDPPNLQANILSRLLPRDFGVSCVLSDAFFELKPVIRVGGYIGAEEEVY